MSLTRSGANHPMLLYVMSDHPSVSQTFVVTEAASVRATGVPVLGYALQRGSARHAAAPMDLVCPPPPTWRLALVAAKMPRRCCQVLLSAKRDHISLREAARLLLAEAHAQYAWPYVKDLQIKHIHAHFLGRTADVAQAIAQRLRCKWTATAHAADAYTPAEPALFRRRIDDVSGIVCANERVEKAIVRHASQDALTTRVIHCGVDVRMLQRIRKCDALDAPHVLTIARLVATKGHWTILQAAEDALTRDETLRWTIIGGGELYDALRADERYRALCPRLKLSGPMDHESALRQLAGASAFVLPCEPNAHGDSDGIPVALMEAMALGVPVITTDIGGIRELVVDRVTGFMVPPRDSTSILKALNTVLYDMHERELARIRSSALAKVLDEFSADREAAKLIEFLAQATGRTCT